MIGGADSRNELFLARGADHTETPTDINESAQVAWIPLDAAVPMIHRGEMLGSGSVIGVLCLLAGGAATTAAPLPPTPPG